MEAKQILEIAGRLMRQPTAPYHEDAVRAQAEEICRENDLPCRRDRAGNLVVEWRPASRQRSIVFSAHLDHPGWAIRRSLGRGRWLAEFLGGVPEAYFRRSLSLRLYPGDIPAVVEKPAGKPKWFIVHQARAKRSSGGKAVLPPPTHGVWDMEAFAVRGGRINGRACDDLIGVAAILATLMELRRRRTPVNVMGLLTRAEEVGFQGALLAATGRLIPTDALVISLETSREMPPVKMGQGVIVRVGDRASIFDSAASRFLSEMASFEQKRDPAFRWQRALMSGGTCEGTAYQEFGYQTAAVCVALGNYHNCGPRNRLQPEYVSTSDVVSMVRLLVAAAAQARKFKAVTSRLPDRLNRLLREARKRLA